MINHFNSNIAIKFGLNAAIFIQALSQWTFNNLANKRHLYDGYCWSYNTLEAYETIFPWWSKRQLETLINSLVKEGLIVKGNYNNHKYDRTCWYALTYMAMEFYPELLTQNNLKALLATISPKWEMETPDFYGNTILENHFTKMRNGVHQNVTPIPTSKPTKDISKDISNQNSQFFDSVESLNNDNPHDIPEQMLEDFITNRKSKKAKITKTAWGKINKTLTQIEKELGIKPLIAFETMVAHCWQSIDVKYFRDEKKRKGTHEPKKYY